MFKQIGTEVRAITERAKARRQSIDRWFMDREGTVHINVASLRRKAITAAELEAIDEAVRDFANDSLGVH